MMNEITKFVQLRGSQFLVLPDHGLIKDPCQKSSGGDDNDNKDQDITPMNSTGSIDYCELLFMMLVFGYCCFCCYFFTSSACGGHGCIWKHSLPICGSRWGPTYSMFREKTVKAGGTHIFYINYSIEKILHI